MSWALLINRVLLTLLSVSTGVVKLVQMEEEMVIFRGAGLPDQATIALGVVQVVGGLLLIANPTHRVGAAIMIPTFMLATAVLFVNGLVPFGMVSLLFPASAALALWAGPRLPVFGRATAPGRP
jgi:hypothetical protein